MTLWTKKGMILIRELMDLIDEARTIQEEIDTTFTYAYQCLQRANIEHGISMVELLAYTVPIENSITIQTRSIMGTEIPHVKYVPDAGKPTYSFSTTQESIDKAREAFRKVKDLTIKLSMVENAAYRLASNIKKTQKRGQRPSEYHNSHVLFSCVYYYKCTGGKRQRRVYQTESHKTYEDKQRIEKGIFPPLSLSFFTSAFPNEKILFTDRRFNLYFTCIFQSADSRKRKITRE